MLGAITKQELDNRKTTTELENIRRKQSILQQEITKDKQNANNNITSELINDKYLINFPKNNFEIESTVNKKFKFKPPTAILKKMFNNTVTTAVITTTETILPPTQQNTQDNVNYANSPLNATSNYFNSQTEEHQNYSINDFTNEATISSNINSTSVLASTTATTTSNDYRYGWERRKSSLTPSSTVLNSPDILQDTQYQQHDQHKIKLGLSPVSSHCDSKDSTSPVTPTEASVLPPSSSSKNLAVCSEGEFVIFNDIDDEKWNRYRHENGHKHKLIVENNSHTNSDISNVTKMIGILPITEYEGSPRRFGVHYNQQHHTLPSSKNLLASPTLMTTPLTTNTVTTRPGYPQRILIASSTNDTTSTSENPTYTNANVTTTTSTSIATSTTKNNDTILQTKNNTLDYLYEFSETRKVLEDFFKSPNSIDNDNITKCSDDDWESGDDSQEYDNKVDSSYIGERLAKLSNDNICYNQKSPPSHVQNRLENQQMSDEYYNNEIELYLDSNSRSSGELGDTELDHNVHNQENSTRHNITLSPETTDYDSNCGDLDSLSNDINGVGGISVGGRGCSGDGTAVGCGSQDYGRLYTSMPVLEDGLSSGHASDVENNITNVNVANNNNNLNGAINQITHSDTIPNDNNNIEISNGDDQTTEGSSSLDQKMSDNNEVSSMYSNSNVQPFTTIPTTTMAMRSTTVIPPTEDPLEIVVVHENNEKNDGDGVNHEVEAALKDIQTTLQQVKVLPSQSSDEYGKTTIDNDVQQEYRKSPVWIPRCESISHESNNSDNISKPISAEEEEADTDLETDRLLGQQRLDEQIYFDDKKWTDRRNRAIKSSSITPHTFSTATIRQGIGTSLTVPGGNGTTKIAGETKDNLTKCSSPTSPTESLKLKGVDVNEKQSRNKEALWEPAVLIEGVLFRARYLGSTQLVCEGQPTKSTRMMQAEEAVSRIKAPEGENQPSTEVDLFISTEKIMVLNTDLKEIMMDHALRSISYIADIGDLVVLMARRRFVPPPPPGPQDSQDDVPLKPINRTPKMVCHVFESEEAQFIAQSIGQAFQVAYMEFLKANGIEDHSFVKEMDYQEVLNSQEIFGDELEIFAKKELQKVVVVPKAKGEILGVVIVESGWGSMLPTVVIANLLSSGAAARCGQLNIGDQLIAINGLSLVGLPLSMCQTYIRNTKNQTAVKFTVVPCPPVVEVKIKRPNTKYQLGFSVQNGVICSLLRGGIAERGGVRVGHRIIEINNQSVVAVPHEKIVNLLATSVGEILMKTMPTSMFRLLTGQENPVYI